MSANDPKQTLVMFLHLEPVDRDIDGYNPVQEGAHEAARVHRGAGGCGDAAVSGTRAATRLRRIGIMLTNAESDRDGRVRLNLFREGLEKLGWSNLATFSSTFDGGPDRLSELEPMQPRLWLRIATRSWPTARLPSPPFVKPRQAYRSYSPW